METLEYRFRDKSKWGDGPWLNEPDKKQWRDEATGLPCLIVRGPSGALCGYVGVSPSHPLFGIDYDSADLSEHPHGGLTFADKCAEDSEHGICHKVAPGEPDLVWWLGFDCAHAGDLCPAHREYTNIARTFLEGDDRYGEQYRNFAYVEAECAQLAKTLAEFAKPQAA